MTTQLSPQEHKAKLWAEADSHEGATTTAQPVNEAGTEQVQQQEEQHQAAAAAPDKAAVQVTAADSKGAAAEDPYAGLPQFVRDEIVGMKTMLSQTVQRLRQAEGHIGGLNSQLKQAVQRVQQAADDGSRQPSAAEVRAAQTDSKAMAKLLEDYPDFGAAVKGALDEQMAAIKASLAAAKTPADAAPAAGKPGVTQADLEAMRNNLLVESRHPGWEKEVVTPEFAGWLQRQPREVQMLAGSDDPQDAIRLLDLRAQARAPARQQQQRLNSAAALQTRGANPSAARAKPVENMTKEEYWQYLDSLEKQGT